MPIILDISEIQEIGKRPPQILTESLKLVLETWICFLSYKYNFKRPSLCFYDDFPNCCYCPYGNDIILGEDWFQENTFNLKVNPYLSYKIKNLFEQKLFVLFHELAHCLQFQRHLGWYRKRAIIKKDLKINISFIQDKDYRKLKEEKFADRIALYWLKKYYKED